MRDDLGFSPVELGLLTGIPVLCFSLAAPLASLAGRKLGAGGGHHVDPSWCAGWGRGAVGRRRVTGHARDGDPWRGHHRGQYRGAADYPAGLTPAGRERRWASIRPPSTSVRSSRPWLRRRWPSVGLAAGVAAGGAFRHRGRALSGARRRPPGLPPAADDGSGGPAAAGRQPASRWITVGLTFGFAGQAISYYGVTAWLPTLLADELGMAPAAAGRGPRFSRSSRSLAAWGSRWWPASPARRRLRPHLGCHCG